MEIRASVETEEQLAAALSVDAVGLLYLDEACFPDTVMPDRIRRIRQAGKRAGLRLRRIFRTGQAGAFPGQLLLRLSEEDAMPDAVLLRSLDEIGELLESDVFSENPLPVDFAGRFLKDVHEEKNIKDTKDSCELVFDYTVYGYNRMAAQLLRELSADRLCYPVELSLPELLSLKEESGDERIPALPVWESAEHAFSQRPFFRRDPPRYELLVYGHLPMMVSANCLQKTLSGCDRQNRLRYLLDRRGKRIPCRAYCKYCYNQIFNAEPCVLYDLSEKIERIAPDSLRYDFSIESGDAVRKILQGYRPETFTRGHFHQKME